jgi:hypothetical protein
MDEFCGLYVLWKAGISRYTQVPSSVGMFDEVAGTMTRWKNMSIIIVPLLPSLSSTCSWPKPRSQSRADRSQVDQDRARNPAFCFRLPFFASHSGRASCRSSGRSTPTGIVGPLVGRSVSPSSGCLAGCILVAVRVALEIATAKPWVRPSLR